VADFVIAPLEQVDALVVDREIDGDYRKRLADAGIDVIIAEAMAVVRG
jgi:DeoR/GlpR family transcriptional regulator of sugar metabolism